jgi:hypothetical protein
MIAAKVIATAPFGHSVTIQKSATAPITTNARPSIDQRRKPIGDPEAADATIPSSRPGRIGKKQNQPAQGLRDTGQHFTCLVSEQAQRRRARWQRDEPLCRRVTGLEQSRRIGHPACRLIFLGPRTKWLGHLGQHSIRFPPGTFFGRSREENCRDAPAGKGGE